MSEIMGVRALNCTASSELRGLYWGKACPSKAKCDGRPLALMSRAPGAIEPQCLYSVEIREFFLKMIIIKACLIFQAIYRPLEDITAHDFFNSVN